MSIKFVRSLPPRGGRDTMNPDRANELLDEMLANNGMWAEVPITHLYPDIGNLPQDRLRGRARSFADRIRQGTVPIFNDYPCEAVSRGANVYMRTNLNKRQLKEMEL